MMPPPTTSSNQQTYCIAYRGCIIYLLQRLNEQQKPKTTFYIFDEEDDQRELAHAFYLNLGSVEKAESILKSWIDVYRQAQDRWPLSANKKPG